MDFVALDVETANADMASICQIGVARFADGRIVEEWESLLDPEDYFDFVNVSIHGIDEEDVIGYPTFPAVVGELDRFLKDQVCVCHTHFDRVSIARARAKYSLPEFEITWLDSARVARRTWEDCAWSGYGLANVCEKIGYEFEHHDALEDAKACGHILLAAIDVSGLDLDTWRKRVRQPIDRAKSSSGSDVEREGEL